MSKCIFKNFWEGLCKALKGEYEETKKGPTSMDIVSPLKGKLIKLSDVKDEAFATGLLGEGVAIIPTSGAVFAPFDGDVISIFPTKHAISLMSKEGVEILIHIGMDTVKLEGEHFKAFVSDGAAVVKGQKLLEFNIKGIKNDGYLIETPILVTNGEEFASITLASPKESVGQEDVVMTINF